MVGVARALAGAPSFYTFLAPSALVERGEAKKGEKKALRSVLSFSTGSRVLVRVTWRRDASQCVGDRRHDVFINSIQTFVIYLWLFTFNFHRTRVRDIESVITKRKQDNFFFVIFLVRFSYKIRIRFLFICFFTCTVFLVDGWCIVDKREKKRFLFVRSRNLNFRRR